MVQNMPRGKGDGFQKTECLADILVSNDLYDYSVQMTRVSTMYRAEVPIIMLHIW